MKALDLRGLVPAPVTPFTRDGAVDYAAIQRIGKWLASIDGVKGLTVLGHAGEGTFLERDEQLKVKLQPLADGDLPLMLLEDEQMRRYREMAAMYGDNIQLPERAEVVLNSKCEAIRALAAVKDPELQKLLAKQYFDIARMSTRPLENEELSAFIRQSYQLAARLAEKED